MTLLAATPDNAIQCHQLPDGLVTCETEFDEQVCIDGEWWYCDMWTGELLDKVEVN